MKSLCVFALFISLAINPAGAFGEYSICFSPGGNCTAKIVAAISQAKASVRVQAYSFTSRPIANALAEASHRGVKVEFIIDANQVQESRARIRQLKEAGVWMAVDGAHAIAHNKIIIIDRQRVVTGSFNFTTSAEYRNAENVVFIDDRASVELYLKNWFAHREHSKHI